MKYKIKIVKFSHDRKKHTFIVKTNMQDAAMGAALVNWLARTQKCTLNAFCQYIQGKMTEYKCYPFKFRILKIKTD